MKTTVAILCLIFAFNTQASLVQGFDKKNNCTLYRVVNSDSKIQQQNDEVVIIEKDLYGITVQNLSIDFTKKEASLQVVANVIFGLNRPLFKDKSRIEESNPYFNFILNQLNRKLDILEEICISKDNRIIHAKKFDLPEEK